MSVPTNPASRVWIAYFLSVLWGVGTGCGIVYTPQEFEKSIFTYGYKGDFETGIEVIPMTFMSARIANTDGFVPKQLPKSFSDVNLDNDITTRERLEALGLDQVDPALTFSTPPAPSHFAQGGETELPIGSQASTSFDPYTNSYVPNTAGYTSSPSGLADSSGIAFSSNSDLSTHLERPTLRRQPNGRSIPDIAPGPYRIGPGDMIDLQRQLLGTADSGTNNGGTQYSQELLVQDNGQIYLPEVGPIDVGGMTVDEMREIVSEQLISAGLDFNPGLNIAKFGSKSIAVSGLGNTEVIPITMRPTTLSEAIVVGGGFGKNPENTIVRVLREGTVYEMSGDKILSSSNLANRILIDGDIVSITLGYDPERVLTYFDQQLRLREVERDRYQDELADRNEARLARAEARAISDSELDRERYSREVSNYHFETSRQTRQETREVQSANLAERTRERAERLKLLELELNEERARLDQLNASRQQSRELFNEQVRLGMVQQDYVILAGEVERQKSMPMPYGGKLSLNRVLFEEDNGGIDPITGDSSEIYVIRTHKQDNVDGKVTAYHLNASNPAALAVANAFEMRPNDIVYVNPQPITNWNRVISQLLPSTTILQSGISTAAGL